MAAEPGGRVAAGGRRHDRGDVPCCAVRAGDARRPAHQPGHEGDLRLSTLPADLVRRRCGWLLDANTAMYLVGAEHPNNASARRLVEASVSRQDRLLIDDEVLQKIRRRYAAPRSS